MSHDNESFQDGEMRGSRAYDTTAKPAAASMCAEKKGPPTYAAVNMTAGMADPDSKGSSQLNAVFVVHPGDHTKNPKRVQDEYMPYEHRKVAHPTSNAETLLHLLKGSLGTGILAMPLAFYNSGYVIGIIGTISIGLICTYCIHLLISSQYELCKRKHMPVFNYPETAVMALGEGPKCFRIVAPYSGHVVNTFLLIYQIGTCCVYVVFVSSNIKSVVDEYAKHMDVRIYMLIILLPLILINWIRSLKLLAPFSTFANLLTLVGFGMTLYYVFDTGISFDGKQAIGHLRNLPLFFGTVLFALESIGVMLPLENNMKTPSGFASPCGVLNQAMAAIITLYVVIGFCGYLKYGSESLGSITLNLPKDDIMAQCVKVMLAVAIFTSHSLQCYVAIDITWNGYMEPNFADHKHKTFIEYAVRTCIVLVTFLLAAAVPNLELFISLFGALCLSALGIGIPAMIQTFTFWNCHPSKLSFYASLAKNLALIIFAMLGLLVGTYTSLAEIIATFT